MSRPYWADDPMRRGIWALFAVGLFLLTFGAIAFFTWARMPDLDDPQGRTRVSNAQMYAVFQILALLTAIALRPKSLLPWRRRLALYAGAIAGAGIGSKLPFAITGSEPFWAAGAWFTDGKTILAGMAGGYIGVEIAKLVAGIREKTGDGFAVPLAAAVAVGRWGCWFNGCCSAPNVPVPIIESAFHATMAFILWRLQRIDALRHQRLKLYLISYCIFRFGIEFVRTEPRIAWGLTAYQFGAAAFAAALAVHWVVDSRLYGSVETRATAPWLGEKLPER
ncbi:MAG: prolipoprotein diacylglyceryl [Planctomycetota bacterium]|nr:MAG: prolipoprotein diacylglyceryl [Planctomycetota bacterium]